MAGNLGMRWLSFKRVTAGAGAWPIVCAGLHLCLGGCSNRHTSGPEAWWHEAIGGKISEQRPPPPGDKDPYPNLATVPPKPAAAERGVVEPDGPPD